MQLRVVTYNIHKCIGGTDRRYAPERIRDVLAHYEPDLVLLQEVDDGAVRSNRDRQFETLGDMIGLRHRVWFPNVRVSSGGRYGNAILSRHPLTETSNIDLTIPPKKRRSALHARYRVRSKNGGRTRTLHVFNLHLGLSGFERRLQLQRFLSSRTFATLDTRTPIVLAGDLNDVWGTLGKKLLIPAGFRGPSAPHFTFPAIAPVRALDGFYVRGDVEIERMYRSKMALAREASDHLPLIGEIRMGARPSRG